MDRLLVTGHDQGLGVAIVNEARSRDFRVEGIPGSVMKGANPYHIREAVKKVGKVTHVVNNYGINHLSWIGTTPLSDEQIILTNVMGPYWIVDSLVRKGNGPCRIVNVASQTYRVAQRCTALYCASKAALVQMTRVMARELAPRGWIINAIAPGAILGTKMTQMTEEQILKLRNWDPAQAEEYAKNLIPMGRKTTTMEVANAILDLLTAPSFINGSVIDMTGGQ